MVSATTFLLIFILLLPLRFTIADTQLQGKNIPVVRGNLETATSTEIYHGVAESDQRTRFLPGRKMMSRGSKNGNNDAIAKGSSSNTKTKGEGLNYHEEGEEGIVNNVKHKFSKRSRKVKVSGFVPLNADYYVPRPHPPKNN